MTPITLDEIKAAQDHVATLIAKYEAAAATPAPVTTLHLAEVQIELKAGEVYAGALLDDAGTVAHHLILLPGEADDITWEAAKAWAIEAGGELPTRREQSLLFANCKQHFKPEWHWSSEQYSDRNAWIQGFNYGNQGLTGKGAELRARAVRRFKA